MGLPVIFQLATAAIGLGLAGKKRSLEQQGISQNTAAAQLQSQAEVEELSRQQGEIDRNTAEKKSDRVREADKQFASMIVSMGEMGGAGTVNEARFAVEIAANQGLDLARIESNRRADIRSVEASKAASKSRATTAASSGAIQKKASDIRFLGSGLSIATTTVERTRKAEAAKRKT